MRVAFVLGAGASKDYGYPLGGELKDQLLEITGRDKALRQRIIAAGHSEKEFDSFNHDLIHADYDTIDQFLGAHQSHPFIKPLGKKLIAATIAAKESHADLFKRKGPHWYKVFLEYLRRKPDRATADSFTFFTFNYDRSPEHYLHKAMSASGGKFTPNLINAFLENNFIHIHGHVGLLPWQTIDPDARARGYGDAPDDGHLRSAGHDIITPEEDLTLSDDLKARLMDADLVVLMGIGFHEQNMRKINFSELVKRNGKNIYATVPGVHHKKREQLRSNSSVKTFDLDCLNFIMRFVDELESGTPMSGFEQ